MKINYIINQNHSNRISKKNVGMKCEQGADFERKEKEKKTP